MAFLKKLKAIGRDVGRLALRGASPAVSAFKPKAKFETKALGALSKVQMGTGKASAAITTFVVGKQAVKKAGGTMGKPRTTFANGSKATLMSASGPSTPTLVPPTRTMGKPEVASGGLGIIAKARSVLSGPVGSKLAAAVTGGLSSVQSPEVLDKVIGESTKTPKTDSSTGSTLIFGMPIMTAVLIAAALLFLGRPIMKLITGR